jgi:hypothetical protein
VADDAKRRGDQRDRPVLPLARERERTIELLSEHFAEDNLSMDELERRIEQAYQAASVSALRELTDDLPTGAASAVAPRRGAAQPEIFSVESDRIVSILGATKRRGVWRPARHLDVWSIMSEMHLDLTEALLPPGVTEIHVRAVMAQVKVIVPPGVRVVAQPSAFMAEVSDETVDPPAVGSDAPVVRIIGPVFMSELKVFVRHRERHG